MNIQELIDYQEEKLYQLKSYVSLMEKVKANPDDNVFDDQLIALEEHIHLEYGIELDSYGEVINE